MLDFYTTRLVYLELFIKAMLKNCMKYQAIKRCRSFSSYFYTSFSYIVLLFLLKNSTPTVFSTFPLILSEESGLCWLLKLRQIGTQRVHLKQAHLWLVRCSRVCRYRRFCSALAALVGQYIYFFPTVHYYTSFFPIVQQAGLAVVPGRLSLPMCLWFLFY